MLCVWLENNQIELKTISIPSKINSNDIIIKIIRAGICNTDLELIQGYYPYNGVLGHEFVGIVIDGPENYLNKRVVGEINVTCLSNGLNPCKFCLNNNSSHCSTRSVIGIVNHNGALAEYLRIPYTNLHILPDSISTDHATFIEPLAAALEIQEQYQFHSNLKVLVIGDGKLGQLVAQTLALTGCELIILGHHEDKLLHLKNRGINTSTSLSDDFLNYFDITVECTGNSSGFVDALKFLRPRGTLFLKSTYANNLDINISIIVVNEITLIGSRCGPFDKAIEVLKNNSVDVSYLIEAKYSIKDSLLAFQHAQRKGTLKILIDMENI